mmetsp:Transcript_20297/g.52646  ORF Transcript_20297/g.52646 Transcript_20297/m.52646 type:complete len:204 (-) Transcript_20297:828-1439(-)
MSGRVVEVDKILDHAHGLVERAELIVRRHAVLLEEVVLEVLGHLKRDLVCLGERPFADELHNLGEVVLGLHDVLDLVTAGGKLWELTIVEVFKSPAVLGVTNEPVDRWEVLALRELLVEPPEHLHDTEGGRRDRVGEVTTWRRHGTDNRNRASLLGRAEALDLAGTLVERGKAGPEVRWVARVGRHFGKTARDFTKRLGPTRG